MAIASRAGRQLTRLNLSEQTDLSDLFGLDVPNVEDNIENNDVGTFAWQDAPFLTAMREGHWVLLDEMNLASQSILEGLNACIDQRGEVYIPELDKSFTSHPQFRLFACQNPHHQGSGRKGLPVSFVNRFTVIFADALSEEDLITISSQSFQHTEESNVVRAVKHVETLARRSVDASSFGVLGRPWEFNLRDTSRLLELFAAGDGLSGALDLSDCSDVLFAHRFRSIRDIETVCSLMEESFGPRRAPKTLFYNLGAAHLQVGGASLLRRPHPAKVKVNALSVSERSLKPLESIMFSIRYNWPVLLVGPEQSCKVNLVSSLASAVGAQLNIISMSADMDTHDLIGSFDHVDHQAGFNDALTEIEKIEGQLCRVLLDLPGDPETAAKVSRALRFVTIAELPVQRIISRLSAAAELLDECQLPDVASIETEILALRSTCERIHLQPSENRAGFQWMDGPLVTALQKGHWLVLENANLASPSVLDRLNSLLEPRGTLAINEHCNTDGSPQVVHPHKNFRLFLTMDPKYGEISRAMRNRTVEIFLQQSEDTDTPGNGEGALASQMILPLRSEDSRLAEVLQLSHSPSHTGWDIIHVVERLSWNDLQRLPAYLNRGFRGFDDVSPKPLTSQVRDAQQILNYDQPMLQDISLALRQQLVLPTLSPDWQDSQPLQLLLNQPYVCCRPSKTTNFLEFGMLFDLVVDLSHARQYSQKPVNYPSAADTCIMSVLDGIHAWVKAASKVENMQCSDVMSTWSMLWLCFQFLHNEQVRDSPLLRAYAGTMERHLEELQFGDSATLTLLQHIQSMTASLHGSNGRIERSMEHLWLTLKGPIFQHQTQVAAMEELQQFAERVDRLPQLSPSLLREVSSLWRSIHVAQSSLYAERPSEPQIVTNGWNSGDQRPKQDDRFLPHFRKCFDMVAKLTALVESSQSTKIDDEQARMIKILAGRRLRTHLFLETSNEPVLALKRLSFFIGFDDDGECEVVDSPTLQTSLTRSINGVMNGTIGQLPLLRDESLLIGKVLATQLPLMPWTSDSLLMQHLEDSLSLFETLPMFSQHTRETVERYLGPVRRAFANRMQQNAQVTSLTKHFVSIGLAYLYLYVPNQPYDPSSRIKLEQDLHASGLRHLQTRLRTVTETEEQLTGLTDSLRIQVVRREIHDLRSAPVIELPARQVASSVKVLDEAFTAATLLRQKVSHLLNSNLESALGRPDVVRDCQRIVDSLLETPVGFRDVARPLIYFVQCIKLGVALALRSERNGEVRDQPQMSPSNQMSLKSVPRLKVIMVDKTNRLSKDEALRALEEIGLVAQVANSGSLELYEGVSFALSSLHDLYQELHSRAQRADAKISSIFHYRDPDSDDQAPEDSSLDAMFESKSPSDLQARIKELSLATVRACFNIFSPDQSPVEQLEISMLRSTGITDGSGPFAEDATAVAQSWAWLNRGLDHQTAPILTELQADQKYNIYTDINIAECSKLRSVVVAVKTRFEMVAEHWTEHAVLHTVITICDHILQTQMHEPVSKNITRAEQLHSAVDEWSRVASREFSVATEYQALTAIIVDWRRMELSTWARLLDLETARAEEEASNWWFVAYQNTVVAIQSLETELEGRVHMTQVISTLEQLLRNSTCGQFGPRLRIIKTLRQCIESSDMHSNSFVTLTQSLANIENHYARYAPKVASVISESRAAVDKEVQNVIRLASWRDTNVLALKQSSKSSHNKLIRLVRKFRDSLNEPCLPHLAAPEQTRILESTSAARPPTLKSEQLPVLPRCCASWPALYANPMQTAGAIRSMASGWDLPGLGTAQRLRDLKDGLNGAAKDLRDATPATATEDNAAAVRHLTTRKQRLLADTFKDLQHAGLKPNQSPAVLQSQSSSAHVFAQLSLSSSDSINQASLALHDTVEEMDRARRAPTAHSNDISRQDVSRGLGYLEALLALCLQQRVHLNSFAVHKQKLGNIRNEVVNALMVRTTCIAADPAQKGRFHSFEGIVSWMPVYIGVGLRLLKSQAKLGELDLSSLQTYLQTQLAIFAQLHSKLRRAKDLPVGLVSSEHLQLEQIIQEAHASFRADLIQWQHELPVANPTIAQLMSWSEVGPSSQGLFANGSPDGPKSDLVKDLPTALDLVLAALQDVAKVCDDDGEPCDDKSWLVKSANQALKILMATRLESINYSLEKLLGSLHHHDSRSDVSLEDALSMLAYAVPVISQYEHVIHQASIALSTLHDSCSTTLRDLCRLFNRLAERGFCKPTEPMSGQGQTTEKLEAGTGLGEGDAAEDISKDIQPDEDLSELAAEKGDQRGGDLKGADDAVSINEDMQGDAAEKDQDEEHEEGAEDPSASKQPQDEQEIGQDDEHDGDGGEELGEDEGVEDAVGNTDDLDPSTVDEKFWQDRIEREEKEDKKGKQPVENKGGEENSASKDPDDKVSEAKDSKAERETELDGSEDGKELEGSETDEAAVDMRDDELHPYAQEADTMDLPEDLNLDAKKNSDDEMSDLASDEDVGENIHDGEAQSDFAEGENEESAEGQDERDHDELPHDSGEQGYNTDGKPPEQSDHQNAEPYAEGALGEYSTGTAQGVEQSSMRMQGGDQGEGEGEENHWERQQQELTRDYQDVEEQKTPETGEEDGVGVQKGTESAEPLQQAKGEDERQLETIRKLGSELERWQRARQSIREHTKQHREQAVQLDTDMTDEFEHLPNEEATADTQVLGGATEEQARPLDASLENKQATAGQKEQGEGFLPDAESNYEEEDELMNDIEQDTTHADATDTSAGRHTTTIGQSAAQATDDTMDMSDSPSHMSDLPQDLSDMALTQPPPTSFTHATTWSHHENSTHTLALYLVEQLREILRPTSATKPRGDFRSGKRLNLKRIIPYIASGYKRDKIWMRRSVPSKVSLSHLTPLLIIERLLSMP